MKSVSLRLALDSVIATHLPGRHSLGKHLFTVCVALHCNFVWLSTTLTDPGSVEVVLLIFIYSAHF